MKKTLQSLLIVVFLITVYSLSKSLWDSYQKLSTLSSTEAQIKQLREENQKLEAEKNFRNTNYYVEKEARDKLGLGKDNETSYVVQQIASSSAEAESNVKLANWQAWLKLFF